jgi:acyl carrier protein phosphodiesterase
MQEYLLTSFTIIFLPTIIPNFRKQLETFADYTYKVLQSYQPILPERFGKILPYMISQNWLYNYKYERGIESSFGGIFRRAKYLLADPGIFTAFEEHYDELCSCYQQFFLMLKHLLCGNFA